MTIMNVTQNDLEFLFKQLGDNLTYTPEARYKLLCIKQDFEEMLSEKHRGDLNLPAETTFKPAPR